MTREYGTSKEAPSPPPSHPSSPLSSADRASTIPKPTSETVDEEDPDIIAIREAALKLRISTSDDEDEQMFRSLEAIFRNAQEQERSIDPQYAGTDNLWAVLRNAENASQHGIQDVPALRTIAILLEQMVWSESRLMVVAARTLGDASREVQWRLPFAESGILELFFRVLGTSNITDELAMHSLRLIGNCCSDLDENREKVVENGAIPLIIRRLNNPRLIPIAIPVLFNVCVDYEPAQKESKDKGLGASLISLLTRDSLAPPLLGYACRMLDMMSDDYPVGTSPIFTVQVLLKDSLNASLDADDCISLADFAIIHLREEIFQQHIIREDYLDLAMKLLLRSTSGSMPSSSSQSGSSSPTRVDDEFSTMRISLVETLAEISSLPSFSSKYEDLSSPFVQSLIRWLNAPHPNLQLCACLMLGNLARSDPTCRAMVSDLLIYRPLLSLLKTSSDPQVLHAALGFLRNLGLLPENKQILGDADILGVATRFWTSDATSAPLTTASISLIRQITNASLPNVRKLLASLSPDPESPAHSRTQLSVLLSIFQKSDDITTRMEIARLVAASFRCIHASGNGNASPRRQEIRKQLQHRLCSLHPDLAQPLAIMVSQTRWPALRSEGWFSLALMARSPEGVVSIDSILEQAEVFGALEETIRGRSSLTEPSLHLSVAAPRGLSGSPEMPPLYASASPPATGSQSDEIKSKDRDNALILVHELLKNMDDDASSIQRTALEDLLNGGHRARNS
ncbi:hypothetical protein MMC25_004440 [Agyrium rufum]|nr:hypothetical protein [Agyrium rufum]